MNLLRASATGLQANHRAIEHIEENENHDRREFLAAIQMDGARDIQRDR
jgi:hypothetical protein